MARVSREVLFKHGLGSAAAREKAAPRAVTDPWGHKANATWPVVFSVELPDRIKSANELPSRRDHTAEAKNWRAVLAATVGHHQPPDHRQRLTLTRVLAPGEHELDFDNLTRGSARAIVNALKLLGYVRDDSPRWLEAIYLQDGTARAGRIRTRLLLEEALPHVNADQRRPGGP